MSFGPIRQPQSTNPVWTGVSASVGQPLPFPPAVSAPAWGTGFATPQPIAYSSPFFRQPMASLPGVGALPTPDVFLRSVPGLPASQSLGPAVEVSDFDNLRAQKYKDQGNHYRQLQLFDKAIESYHMALTCNPRYTDPWFNLAETYVALGDIPQAANSLTSLLRVNPMDHEARSLLAEHLATLGQSDKALAHYRYTLAVEPNFDPAQRGEQSLLNRLLYQKDPFQAQMALQKTGNAHLAEAKTSLTQYFTERNRPDKIALLNNSRFVFEMTQTVNQIPNLAEYDHGRGVIRITPELAFAHPNVLGAYIAHELEHAQDQDGLTSLWEEEDGYREMAQFWIRFRNGVIEPNLDLAAQLFTESPAKLYQRVDESYQRKDPTIPQRSPGHGLARPSSNAASDWNQILWDRYIEQLSRYKQFVEDQFKGLIPA